MTMRPRRRAQFKLKPFGGKRAVRSLPLLDLVVIFMHRYTPHPYRKVLDSIEGKLSQSYGGTSPFPEEKPCPVGGESEA